MLAPTSRLGRASAIPTRRRAPTGPPPRAGSPSPSRSRRARSVLAAAATSSSPPPPPLGQEALPPLVPGQGVSQADRRYLRRALELARRGLGHTAPNPAVGCVIVASDDRGEADEDDGARVVVGEGYHPRAGLPHAEVYALRAAGELSRGATAYVTLEPCGHHGRTPPCAEALRDAQVRRVVVGCADPNPLVAGGGGLAMLRRAGVQVALCDGPERDACYALNPEFMARMEAEAAQRERGGGEEARGREMRKKKGQ
jgi:diaminohydroxyphosphoribosylaminopyrimidine deaminase / 5-amino-6-(5-phosphoribosylamino)uracil reductase